MDALGIINFEDNTATIDGLGDYRPVPAISFLGRYRIIDFILSNMTNSGIDSVQVYCKEKPRNLIEHLGSGTHYNINSKRGRLRILYGETNFSSLLYNTDITNFNLNMQYIESDQNRYVIIAPSYFIYSFNFEELYEEHIRTGADVTILYKNTNDAKDSFKGCDTLLVDKNHRVRSFEKNYGNAKNRNISLEAYVMSKKLFMEICDEAAKTSTLYWLKDMLAESCDNLDIRGYPLRGKVACINSLYDYYRTSMLLKDIDLARELFKEDWPIYTQTNDSSPTKITKGAKVRNSFIANSCVIEGELDGCIIGRNVKVKKGAKIKDCIILADAVIGEDARLENVVVDKYAHVETVKNLKGTSLEPLYVKRRDHI